MRMQTAYRRDHAIDAFETEDAYYVGLGESGDGAAPTASPWYETVIKSVVPAVTTAYMQNQLTKLNVARLNAGQSPLTAEQFSAAYQPTAANVAIGPDRTAKTLIMIALVGAAVYGGVRVFQGRRR